MGISIIIVIKIAFLLPSFFPSIPVSFPFSLPFSTSKRKRAEHPCLVNSLSKLSHLIWYELMVFHCLHPAFTSYYMVNICCESIEAVQARVSKVMGPGLWFSKKQITFRAWEAGIQGQKENSLCIESWKHHMLPHCICHHVYFSGWIFFSAAKKAFRGEI